jgi:hypothetical protein
MPSYEITRTRLVTERFRVMAESEENACDLVEIADENPDGLEKIEESTASSDITVDSIEVIE